MPSVKIFLSYSRKDYANLAPLFGKFKQILGSITHKGKRYKIEYYWDQVTAPGIEWNETIHWQLKSADVIIFFVSHHFLYSGYILDHEIPIALDRRENAKIHLLPILIDECSYTDSPIGHLQFMPLYKGYHKPMNTWSNKKAFWEYIQFAIKLSIKNSLDGFPDPKHFNPNLSSIDKRKHVELFASPEMLKLNRAIKKRRKPVKRGKQTLLGNMIKYVNKLLKF